MIMTSGLKQNFIDATQNPKGERILKEGLEQYQVHFGAQV